MAARSGFRSALNFFITASSFAVLREPRCTRMSAPPSERPFHKLRRIVTMRKLAIGLLVAIAFFLIAPAAFAQGGDQGAAQATNWVAITSGFAMAIASGACGIAQGRASARSEERRV